MKLNPTNTLLVILVVTSIAAVLLMRGVVQPRSCVGIAGNIFIDCVDPQWHGISSWELRHDNQTEYINVRGTNNDLVQWRVIHSGDPARDEIIDVQYSHVPANGRLRFHVTGAGRTLDMSAFAGGTVSFDVRVLSWGEGERMLVVNFTCKYPCASGPMRLSVPSLNTWHHIEIPVDSLVEAGLDLSKVDIGLAISPTWNRMQGNRFQLDNIRWSKPDNAEIREISLPSTVTPEP